MPKQRKIPKNYTLDEDVVKTVAKMASPQNENRSQSNMAEILLKEAIAARNKKKKQPQTENV